MTTDTVGSAVQRPWRPAAETSVFEPDILLPFQMLGRARRDTPWRRLMVAVLEDAVDVLQRGRRVGTPEGRRTFDDARAWVESTERGWPFAFENVCDAIGVEAAYLRRGLARAMMGAPAVPAAVPARPLTLAERAVVALRQAGGPLTLMALTRLLLCDCQSLNSRLHQNPKRFVRIGRGLWALTEQEQGRAVG